MSSHFIPVGTLKVDGISIAPEIYCPANGFPNPAAPTFPETLQNYPEALGEACSIAGYIDPTDPAQLEDANLMPKVLIPDNGWNLICSFQTNSPSTTTFDPTISIISGAFAWDFGDGFIFETTGSISHTYSDSSTKTVKLYGKGTCSIRTIDMGSDNIVGVLDLSHSAFNACYGYQFVTNNLLTGIIFTATPTVPLQTLDLSYTGITGALNLSMFSSLLATGNGATLTLYSLPNLTGITFASTITGLVGSLTASFTNITGTLDISMFKAFGSVGFAFSCTDNPNLRGLALPTSITSGTVSNFTLIRTGYIGAINMSVYTNFSTSATIIFWQNYAQTGITFASSVTGTLSQLQIRDCNISGTIDVSMFTRFTATAIYRIYDHINVTGLTLPTSMVAGSLSELSIYHTGVVGTLNLTGFTSFNTTTASIYVHTNPAVTSTVFASSVTGKINYLHVFSTGITGVLDVSMFNNFTTSAQIYIYSNPNMSGVNFLTGAITGSPTSIKMDANPSLGYVDFTKLNFNVANVYLQVQNNGWSSAIVNQTLAAINGVSSSGYSGRNINISGTNQSPDLSSGGYDGITSRTNLISKSYTVTATLTVPVLDPTVAASSITQTTASSGGSINNGGGSLITAKGVCWALSPAVPSIANSKTTDGSGIGAFLSSLTALTANKTYIVRDYATNATGTGYGSQISFTTLP